MLDAHVYSCETDVHRLEKYGIKHSTLEFECHPCTDCRVVRELRD